MLLSQPMITSDTPLKYEPVLCEPLITQESTLFIGNTKTVRFIRCKNAYSLATLAKQYRYHSTIYGKIMIDLAFSIALKDMEVIRKLSPEFVEDIREWLTFFKENDILSEYKKKTVFGPSLEYRIVSPEILQDRIYKSCIPFTNLYSLMVHEPEIETMMKEITYAVYNTHMYVSVILPIMHKKILTDEDKIALVVSGI